MHNLGGSGSMLPRNLRANWVQSMCKFEIDYKACVGEMTNLPSPFHKGSAKVLLQKHLTNTTNTIVCVLKLSKIVNRFLENFGILKTFFLIAKRRTVTNSIAKFTPLRKGPHLQGSPSLFS